jgi:uncharacterized protein YbjT (DUF2867 family)
MAKKTVLVTGASGFVGSRLAARLAETGYEVRAMTRHPDTYAGAGTAVAGDVSEPDSLERALDGVTAAYYLVHSLDTPDFGARDDEGARNFAKAAAVAELERVIYLGGLGVDNARLSEHLRSRREVEKVLRSESVPVTVLRAAVIVGHGGISWEITRQLVEHLPLVVTPRWVNTRTQPIAIDDVIRYLVGVLDPVKARGQTYEIGGPDVLRYIDMLSRAAAVERKPLPNFTVPLLTPRLSSAWLALVTDVDLRTARNLVDSMTTEVVVHDHSIENIVPGATISYEDAVRSALDERARAGN